MATCLNCGRFVYVDVYCMDEKIFCTTECKSRYEIKSIALNIPCHHCQKEIFINEGFIVKGKKVFCSNPCLNQSINNLKSDFNE